jgi:hypothetical protein
LVISTSAPSKTFCCTGPGLDQASLAESFGAPDEFGNHLIARLAEGHGCQRDVAGRLTETTPAGIPWKILKEQTAIARLPEQRTHLRARVNRLGNARQQSGLFQLIDPSAHVLSHESSPSTF